METILNIDELREEFKDLSYEEQFDRLDMLENEILEKIDELEANLSDLAEIRDDIEEVYQNNLRDGILLALKDAGYDIPLDDNGCLPIPFTDATVFIPLGYITSDFAFHFTADKDQFFYRKNIASLVPDYTQDGNKFRKHIPIENFPDEIVMLVKRLKAAKM